MIGQTVSHYKIIDKIAQGGMGVIYKARDTKLKRTVALKFLPLDITRDSNAKQRFIHEARSASILDHPNICTIYEIDETEKGQMFIAMAFYKGETIKEKLENNALPLESALDIMVQICDGLSRSHEAGIIHRDIKPANIMVTEREEVKILDFGLAKLGGDSSLTRTGIAVGTAAYMSPEQASGEPVDHRTDIWSLGVMLYEIATKKLPFHGDTPRSMVFSIIRNEPSGMAELAARLPRQLMKIISKCMSKRTRDRYQNMTDLRSDLVDFAEHYSKDKHTIKLMSDPSRTFQRFPRRKIVIFIVLLCSLLGILVLVPTTRRLILGWAGIEKIPQQKHLAIIPFTMGKIDPAAEKFGSGMVRMITDKLMLLEKFENHFWIASNKNVEEEKVRNVSDALRMLGSNLVIIGNLSRNKNRVKLGIVLMNSRTGKQIQSKKFDAHITNLSMWQDEVVFEILGFLDIDLDTAKQKLLIAGGTSFPGAFDFYLQSLGYLSHRSDPEGVDKAIFLLKQAIEQDRFYAAAQSALGEAYFLKYKSTNKREWLNLSEDQLKKAINASPDLWSNRLMLGKVHREQGHFDRSLEQFQQAIQMNPKYCLAYLEMAFTHEDSKSLFKAEEYYKKLINIRPDYWRGYNYLAYFYYSTGRLNEAEEMYLKTHELNRYHISVYNNLIGIYNKKGDNHKAWEIFEKAIELEPNSTAYSNIGNNLFFQGKYEAAKNMYEKAIELGRSDRRIWGNLADSYRYLRTHKNRARQVYQKAIELAEHDLRLDPQNAGVRSSLALYLSKMGEYTRAQAEINRALSGEPNSLAIIYNSIVVYEISKQREKSLQALKAYVTRHGSLPQLNKDPDLDLLRKDSGYRQVLEQRDNLPVLSGQDEENE